MAAIASAVSAAPSRESIIDGDSSNISSPLSDVEDKDEETEIINSRNTVDNNLDVRGDNDTNNISIEESDPNERKQPEADRPATGVQGEKATPEKSGKIILKRSLDFSSPSESFNDDVNDTEAETERLEDTPHHQRHHNVMPNSFNERRATEHTPSSLRRITVPIDNTDFDTCLSPSDNISSPISHIEDDSPIKPIQSTNGFSRTSSQAASQERKRKRSPVVEHVDSEESLRKRPGSVVEQDNPEHEEDAILTDVDDENEHDSGQDTSGELSVAGENNSANEKKERAREEGSTFRETRAAKKSARNGRKRIIGTHTTGGEVAVDGGAGVDVQPEKNGVGGNAKHPAEEEAADDDADPEGKLIEEGTVDLNVTRPRASIAIDNPKAEKKQAAYDEWSNIDEMFNLFRDRLYKDRLDQLDEEEQALLAEGHPEYLAMKQCLDEHFERKITQVQKEYEMSLAAHARKGEAQLSQIWGQFYQSVREKREKMLEGLNEKWYSIQESRKAAHRPPDRILVFPNDPAQRERNSMAYNAEVQNLASIAKHRGFPGAPSMRSATTDEIEDDLQAMRRARQPHELQSATSAQTLDKISIPTSFGGLGPAGEQFIKDNAWANPKHPAHRMSQGQSRAGSRSNSPFLTSGVALASLKAINNDHTSDKPAAYHEILKYERSLASARAGGPQFKPRGPIFPKTTETAKVEAAVAASS